MNPNQESSAPNPNAEQWQSLKKQLSIGDEVYGGYKISSMPFDSRKDAYDEINNYWQGSDVTTYFDKDSNSWFIISK
ncbi:hypothetical protein IKW73_03445 [Candidatus Saccharibacteria bacterium]|nr:hypothetical protein [Candidatus Saccharibacteria bacterium]